LGTDLNFFKFSAGTKSLLGKSVDGSLNDTTGGFDKSIHITLWDSTSAENVLIGEVLCGEVTNGKSRQNDLSSAVHNCIKFFINKIPFGINNLLIVLWVINSDLSILLLSLKLQF